MADPLSWEEWTKKFNESVAPAATAAPAAPATVGGLSQTNLGNIGTILDPKFGVQETLTHGAENAVAGGWGQGGFAGGQTVRLLDSERLKNMQAGQQMLEPYLAREQQAGLQAESERARLNDIAAQGAQALQQLQLSEAGATARLNSQQTAEMQRLITSGQQAMQQLALRETGETARQQAGIGGTLANTIISGALAHGAGAPAAPGTGTPGSRITGMGTGTPGELGITWNNQTPQYAGTPEALTAPTPGAAYNPNARGITTPTGILGGTSIDRILRKYNLIP